MDPRTIKPLTPSWTARYMVTVRRNGHDAACYFHRRDWAEAHVADNRRWGFPTSDVQDVEA